MILSNPFLLLEFWILNCHILIKIKKERYFLQIEVVSDLQVGQNYQDHPIMPINVFFEYPEKVSKLDMAELSTLA